MSVWDTDGPGNDIVITSRVRLARNVAGIPFPSGMTAEQGDSIAQSVMGAVRRSADFKNSKYIQLRSIDETNRQELVERHLASRDLICNPDVGSILLSCDETVALMINEEDHLRIQGLLPGLQIEEAAQKALGAEAAIEKCVPFAFDETLGYLTACPTNVGTGMRASVMVHLPALKHIGMLKVLIDSVVKAGLAVRGIYGEGSEALGDMFQISNQITLGISEDDITSTMKAVCDQIMDKERMARDMLLRSKRLEVEDKLFRSWGVLRHARCMSAKEFMELLSDVRLAVSLGFLTEVSQTELNRLMIAVQPASLQRHAGRDLTAEERDIIRANYIRTALNKTH